MTTYPVIPSLLFIPGKPHSDFSAIYAIATAYAHSGLVISEHGNRTDRPEFCFPVVVCSGFAIELFLKFFLMLENVESEEPTPERSRIHPLDDLWKKISPTRQSLIAGMFRNSTGEPLLNALDRRTELFVEALTNLQTPFLKWRYPYELKNPNLMSHAAIVEVLDALGHAADYVMKQRSRMSQSNTPKPGAS
jgi:hypothetical protein